MQELFFGGQAPWFAVPALLGSLFFVARLAMMFVFGHGDLHADASTDFDLDHGDSSSAFKILSIQAIAAFLMGFGWGGLGAYSGWGLPLLASVPIGFAVGGGMMWILGRLLRWIAGMQSSGTVNMAGALYEEGTIYTAIPAGRAGRGRVRVVIGDRMRYYSAVTDGEALESHASVQVTEINDDNTVTVKRVKALEP